MAAVLLSATLAAAVGELAIRLLGRTDAHGNFYVRTLRLRPYHLPTKRLAERVERYVTHGPVSRRYDPLSGWSPLPRGQTANGLYRYNSAGIRSPVEYAGRPADGVLRIAIFGDSFTHGAEVPFESTWGHLLERRLIEAGLEAEVLNFGVGVYGMDQALLRWRQLGREFHPHVVLFGFQAENTERNLMLFRGVRVPRTNTLLTKPRFVLRSGELAAVNLPTLAPDRIADVLRDFEAWDLARHEYFYDPRDYRSHFWQRSRLLALIHAAVSRPARSETAFYDLHQEPSRLALAIIRAFHDEVGAAGSTFLVVHLPTKRTLSTLRDGGRPPYAPLLHEIERACTVIDPTADLLDAAGNSAGRLFMPGRHYTERANGIVADVSAESLLQRRPTSASNGDRDGSRQWPAASVASETRH